MAESDRLLSDCTPFKGVPRVRIPLSPPFFKTGQLPVDIFVKADRMAARRPEAADAGSFSKGLTQLLPGVTGK